MEHVDSIRIDSDEGGFTLELDGVIYDIHAVALELHAQVVAQIGPYAREAELARATMPPSYEPGDAYSVDDPKHPDWHDAMADMWDSRRNK